MCPLDPCSCLLFQDDEGSFHIIPDDPPRSVPWASVDHNMRPLLPPSTPMGRGGEGGDGGGMRGSAGTTSNGRQYHCAAAAAAATAACCGEVRAPRPVVAVLNPGDMLYL